MIIPIEASTTLIIGLALILFLPALHLFFIFFIMSITEWFDKLFKKIYNLLLSLYYLIEHLLENPIIYLIFIYFLCVSVSHFTAI
jgi:hypothetical protein